MSKDELMEKNKETLESLTLTGTLCETSMNILVGLGKDLNVDIYTFYDANSAWLVSISNINRYGCEQLKEVAKIRSDELLKLLLMVIPLWDDLVGYGADLSEIIAAVMALTKMSVREVCYESVTGSANVIGRVTMLGNYSVETSKILSVNVVSGDVSLKNSKNKVETYNIDYENRRITRYSTRLNGKSELVYDEKEKQL